MYTFARRSRSCWFLPAPARAAFAQAAITGTSGRFWRRTSGRDGRGRQSGIDEKVRAVVTDDTGQYRIVDLRPGDYTVTFSLPGFSTVKTKASS